MNYPQSSEIRELIQKSQRIVINCHRNPDADSVGSSIALAIFAESLGKEVTIVCPSPIPSHLQFLQAGRSIQTTVFDEFDFALYDLFLIPDTSTWDRIFNKPDSPRPTIPTVVIDNHETNKGFGQLNLLDYKTSSACEMVCLLFEDWQFSVTAKTAQLLLAGIVGDTGSFQFEVFDRTLSIAQKLIQAGANLAEINYHVFKSVPLELIKFWAVAIEHIKLDETGFAWIAIPFSEYEPFQHLTGTRETTATMIIERVEGSSFGFVMTETQPKVFSASFRARDQVDVGKIAFKLGGGGHAGAAGVTFNADTFDQAVEKLLHVCRESVLK